MKKVQAIISDEIFRRIKNQGGTHHLEKMINRFYGESKDSEYLSFMEFIDEKVIFEEDNINPSRMKLSDLREQYQIWFSEDIESRVSIGQQEFAHLVKSQPRFVIRKAAGNYLYVYGVSLKDDDEWEL